MTLLSMLQSIVSFPRAGYPEVTAAAIEPAIEEVTYDTVSESGVERVSEHLAAMGLVLDGAQPT